MEHLKRLVLISLLLVALPGVAQEDESAAYFSLASDKTFTPADTPVVRLWGHGFDKLQFRLYRVNDPVAFFQKLEDDHQFGMQPPPRDPKQRTVLEKFRDWKLSTRLRLKNLVRNQFTMDSRREYVTARIEREGNALRDAGPAKVESYAEVPVLNQQQLVATWEQPFSTTNRWESAAVPIPSKGKGLYLVEATNGRLQAYTIVSVSEFGVISKAAPGRLVVRVVNRTTSAPVAGVSVMAFGKDRKNAPKPIATDAQGVAEVPFTETNPESVLVLARNNTDFAPLTIYGGAISRRDDDIYKGYIYTDRPVYRPGHPVNYRIVFRAQEVNGYRVPAGKEVTVDVQDTDGQSVYKAKHTLSAMGTASGQFTLPASAKLGYHSVEVHLGTAMQSGGFEVQEYRKPEYDVRVTPKDARVIQGASVQAVIDARYFYGEPVANANVTWVVHKQRYWAFFFGDDEEDRYESDGESRYAQREQISEETGKLDAEGKLTVTVPTAKDESDQIYRIEARVTDAAGREITGAGRVIATIGAYSLDIRTDRYVYAPGDNAKFNVTARDYDGKGVPGVQVQVALQTWDWRGRNATDLQKGSGITDASGRAEVTLPVSSGSLRAIATSRTPEGRDVEDTQYVWVTGGADMWGGDEERLRIVPDRSSYKPGDTAKILVLAPKGANLWITVEGQAVHRSQFVRNTGSSVTVDVPIQKEFVPNFWVSDDDRPKHAPSRRQLSEGPCRRSSSSASLKSAEERACRARQAATYWKRRISRASLFPANSAWAWWTKRSMR
ncbi:MAG: MG2 domain-containing protein [Bryobacteraceae bacterium]